MSGRIIAFGALAPKLSKQFPGLKPPHAGRFDRDSEAITRLHVRGLLPDGEASKARTRLLKAIGKHLRGKP